MFVEQDGRAVRAITENLRRTGLSAKGTVVRREAAAWLADPGTALAMGLRSRLDAKASIRAGRGERETLRNYSSVDRARRNWHSH